LEAVSIPYKDETGKYADFHALRHTFISSLDHPDISIKVAQSLARHSSISLTLDTYTHPKLYSERAALEKLPELPNIDSGKSKKNKAVSFKTGTDDLQVAGQKTVYKPVYKKLVKLLTLMRTVRQRMTHPRLNSRKVQQKAVITILFCQERN
jgi:hypothetical protein